MENFQEVVDKFLNSDKVFLFGSRSMLKDLDITSDRDWDFAIDSSDYVQDTKHDLYNYIDYKFECKGSYYADSQHLFLLKHKEFPQVTISIKRNLSLFKYVWNRIPFKYWRRYLWKSNPVMLEAFKKDPNLEKTFYKSSIDTFNLMYVMASTDMDEWL